MRRYHKINPDKRKLWARRKGIKPTRQKLTNNIILNVCLKNKYNWVCKLKKELEKIGYPRTQQAISWRVKKLKLLGYIKYVGKKIKNIKYFVVLHNPKLKKLGRDINQAYIFNKFFQKIHDTKG